ncbi:glycosyl transferase [Kineobactrum sediminis]|uniref:Glycosyl transferase n=1 Tax=Kineobactrum sediminis TaxID=1905677 RepID=A0A2N5Y0Q0_9GAMM|nr:glycosyltransferase family 4 protein [Kineobactrum sediminis]PLW81984.1 glycosyl transferase [Kineobactrum sediminis]
MILPLLLAPLLAALLCGLYLRLAQRRHWLDQPNARSSHSKPTPHGGGVGLLSAFVLASILAASEGMLRDPFWWQLSSLALVLMVIGIVDDLVNLPVWLRLVGYSICCSLLLVVLAGGDWLPPGISPWLLWPLLLFGLLWLLNLYNFMDGIDGLAAIQCFLACSGASLLGFLGGAADYALFCLLLALSQLGFLVWNWPPARLFMGDAGSIPIGFLLGGLALYGAGSSAVPLGCWLVLLAAFITDATWTLLDRWRRGEYLAAAHRDHAYQRLSRYWQSHLAVDLLLVVLNALWLFPIALAAWRWPQHQVALVMLAYVPLLVAMYSIRAVEVPSVSRGNR